MNRTLLVEKVRTIAENVYPHSITTVKCWFHRMILPKFEKNYLLNNKWSNTTRLENRKLLTTESAENYIVDMSELALLVGITDNELAKALIRERLTKHESSA